MQASPTELMRQALTLAALCFAAGPRAAAQTTPSPTADESRALFRAIASGDLTTAKAQLPGQKDPFQLVDRDGFTLLDVAARAGQVEAVRLLLAAGAPVDNPPARPRSPLHLAANRAVAEVLTAAGAKVDRVDRRHRTPLFAAALLGDRDLLQLLLDRGAQIDAVDDHDLSALDVAAREGITTAVDLLCSGKAPGYDLVQAVRAGDVATMRKILADPLLAKRDATALFLACRQGRVDLATVLLDSNTDPNCTDEHARTPLHLAIVAGNGELAGLLLQHHARCGAVDGSGETPLTLAVAREDRKLLVAMVACGATLNEPFADGTRGPTTHLIRAIDAGNAALADTLLSAGASANLAADGTTTPLDHAFARGDAQLFELLLAHKADLSRTTSGAGLARQSAGKNYLEDALTKGHVAIAAALLAHGVPVNERLPGGMLPLEVAEIRKDPEMQAMLRAHGAYDRGMYEDLLNTIERGRDRAAEDHVAEILAAAPEITNCRMDRGWRIAGRTRTIPNIDSPLLVASKKATRRSMLHVVVAAGPDPNVFDAEGASPLLRVVSDPGFVAEVLTLKPTIDARNLKSQITALMMAASLRGAEAVTSANLLLAAGADISLADDDGWTALHHAAASSRPSMIEFLLQRHALPGARTKQNETPIFLAVAGGHPENIAPLAAAGADLELRGEVISDKVTWHFSPLDIACIQRQPQAVQALIRAGAKVEAAGDHRLRALHCAAKANDWDCARALLDAGAFVNVVDDVGRTPYDCAGTDLMRSLLRERGGLPGSQLR